MDHTPIPNTTQISLDGMTSLANRCWKLPGQGVFWTSDLEYELPLKLSYPNINNHMTNRPSYTIPNLFKEILKYFSNEIAFRVQRINNKTNQLIWQYWTFSNYYNNIVSFAKSVIYLGLKPFDVIGIIGFNSPEWFISCVGTIFAGCINTGIYITSQAESILYLATHSKMKIIIVDTDEQLAKVISLKSQLPDLIAIVQWGSNSSRNSDIYYTFNDFLNIGNNINENILQSRMDAQQPTHCCSLIYTSGTTGPPKGVMLSHDNVTWTSHVVADVLKLNKEDRIVSYLPLSHIAAQITDIWVASSKGICISFARPDALQGTLVETLLETKPTVFVGVPRVWEKIEEKMRNAGAANSNAKKMLVDWAKNIGISKTYGIFDNQTEPWGYSIANLLVFSTVKTKLGLECARGLFSCAAPISLSTIDFFASLDIPILEIFGTSECTGPQTMSLNHPSFWKLGSVGRSLPGMMVAIKPVPGCCSGEGEICLRGRHVFMGYYKNPIATSKCFDDEGYFHTGDIGKIDELGFLSITGRLKELLITAGGENVAPVLLESNIITEIPAINQAVVVGDRRKFLSVLLTLKTDLLNPSLLAPLSLAFAKEVGSNAQTIADAIECPCILRGIHAGIERANSKAPSRAQIIKKFQIMPQEFTEANGELTPSMKLKRSVVAKKYATIINAFYDEVNENATSTQPLRSRL